MTAGSYTWQEISSQPQTWAATLAGLAAVKPEIEGFVELARLDQIIGVGCGSTHYLAQSAAATLTHCAGIPACAFPSSELWLFHSTVPRGPSLLLAISRSGTTTETLWAVQGFRERNSGSVMAITCYPQSPLAQQADFTLAAPDAQEQSVAQTRSFTSMLILAEALAVVFAGDADRFERLRRLPTALEDLLGRLGDVPQRLGEDLNIERFFFLGAGPLYGLANEAMLKTKELSLSHAEAYHPLEFRHGPMSLVNEQTLVIGLLSDTGLAEQIHVLREMKDLGARTLALVEDDSAFADWRADYVFELRSGLDEWERGPLYLPPLQRLAYHRAMAKGLNPDRPHNLAAVVELQGSRVERQIR